MNMAPAVSVVHASSPRDIHRFALIAGNIALRAASLLPAAEPLSSSHKFLDISSDYNSP